MRQGSGGQAVIRFRAAGVSLLLAHLLLVGWLTLRPLDVPWMTAANLQPFAGIKADLSLGPVDAARRIGKELLLLAPLGVLLPLAGGRLLVSPWASLTRTVAAGALISLAIELGQTAVPGQVVDVDSLFLNTVGIGLAHVLIVPAWRSRLRRRERQGHSLPGPGRERSRTSRGVAASHGHGSGHGTQGSTPTISRVGIAP
ncbi:VanZ family protein [Streptomyces poriferorum]|uniref:VanZ family protein n=1 Tax=Streptomyces poriferorum TaxID=2798799 RepID=UPI00273E5F63|nr:VanZ family protein [Streptomyces sp. Alt1]WLQ50540.1 VanZ family protein [Streptomyces sp. Alt1]